MSKYYTIVDSTTLNSVLPESIKDRMQYKEDKTLKEAAFVKKELTDGSWVVSIQLTPEIYFGRCVQSLITEEDLNLAKQMYGEENVISHEEYSQLDFKTIDTL